MSDRIPFAAMKHDALLAVEGNADSEYKLSLSQRDDAVLALVEAVEAAHENAEFHNPISYKLGDALARFDFEASA